MLPNPTREYGMYLVHVDPSINMQLRASPTMLNMWSCTGSRSQSNTYWGNMQLRASPTMLNMWSCTGNHNQSNTYWGRSVGGDGLREQICTYGIGTIGIWLALCLRALASELFVISNTQRWGHKHWPKNP